MSINNQLNNDMLSFLDDDTFVTASKTSAASSESIKNYIASELAAASIILTPGFMLPYAAGSIPAGWLLCNGAAVSRVTYADLFLVIGTTWGGGDGSTTFNLPNMARRVAVGSGGSSSGILGNAVGNTGGTETVTLTTTEMPSHTHNYNFGTGVATTNTTPNITTSGIPNSSTTSTGSGGAHNNMQPSAVVAYLIKT